MLTGISTIYFSMELAYPDLPNFAIKKEQIRDLYAKLNEPGGYSYENIDLQADIPLLSTRRENGGQSLCQIGKGKIRIVEDKPSFGIDDFVGIVKTVIGGLPPTVGPFISQRCKIRCTAQPANCEDSIDLLAGKLANTLTTIAPFRRPPSFFGVRFRFAPSMEVESDSQKVHEEGTEIAAEELTGSPKGKKKTKKKPVHHRGFYTLRFETYADDIKKVWIEIDGLFIEPFIGTTDLVAVAGNMTATHAFATDNAKKFLDQFDKKEEDETKSE
jgi:hypothetical protein